MGEVELPVVSVNTGIEQALEIMRQAGRSGLVAARPQDFVVLTDEDLVDGLREQGYDIIGQIKPRHRTAVVTPDKPRFRTAIETKGLDRVLNDVLLEDYQHFSLHPQPGSTFRVRTIAEALAGALSQPVVVCTCRTNPRHKWRPQQLNDPSRCNLDGDSVKCQ
jgi:hypothetical protein